MTVNTFNWGILSTGTIATAFAKALNHLDDATALAVGSRKLATAEAFGDKHGIPRRYASYEELAADDDVQIVYVATPHVFHAENVRMCLEHGKHVLCEKPFTVNAAEARELIDLAREKQLFLMEALWMRFIPAIVTLREWLAEGRIGDVRMVQADFSVNMPFDPDSRIYDRKLGGGSLLDVGIYPISLATMVLGLPDRVESHAHIGETGVDEQVGMLFGYEDGRAAVLSCGVRAQGTQEAVIKGTRGFIKLHTPFHHPQQLTLHLHDSEPQTVKIPYKSTGLNYEARAVQKALTNNLLESAIMSLDETQATMQLMDDMRAAWGLRYPADGKQ
jgi:predicted dehydrogenase